jgi:hypothetical protein
MVIPQVHLMEELAAQEVTPAVEVETPDHQEHQLHRTVAVVEEAAQAHRTTLAIQKLKELAAQVAVEELLRFWFTSNDRGNKQKL